VHYFPILSFIGGYGFMRRIGDTGRLSQFAWNFEFLKNISIFCFLSVHFITEKRNWNKMVTWSSTAEKKQLWRAESLQNQIFMNCY